MAPRRYRMGGRRATAIEQTRRRIIAATFELHVEQGIVATSWEDIARRAGVAVATVYRHFPTLDALVTACGELAFATIQPPSAARSADLFAGAATIPERVARLTQELCAFYGRGDRLLELVQRERHQVPALDAAACAIATDLEALVREALRPANVEESAVQVAAALADFAVWKALVDRGVGKEVAADIMGWAIVSWLNGAHERASTATDIQE